MTPPRIVVVGSSNTDMVVKSPRIPRVGETVIGGQFVMAAGGKGANQAVAAARLGAQVTFVARVGQDVFGDQAVAGYAREGIDTSFILRDPEHATGVALILVDDRGENLISVASGANNHLGPEDVDRAAGRIRQADIVLVQLETPVETILHAARLAAGAGVRVILDPAPAPASPLPDALLRLVACVKPNETEAERLTGIAVTDEASARQAAQRLLECGAQSAIVTLGAKGAVWMGEGKAGFVPAFRVEALDSTAAGDAFSGGLACALARGLPLDEAVRYASLVGALSVTRLGAQPSLPTREEVDRFAASARA
ncbi:MAG: ribokinase [Thermoguttaceae bacterium]|jgi:ribokinase|nr:ribokinase [Thermoguttaceae bacterium]